jgi:hypothetical protein
VFFRVFDIRHHRALPARIRQRRHLGVLVETVADLDRFRALGEFLDELLIDALLDQETKIL